MPDQINRAQVDETDVMVFSVDASELGWAPGYFPESVSTDLGNRCNLVLLDRNDARARYAQDAGCVEVIVYND